MRSKEDFGVSAEQMIELDKLSINKYGHSLIQMMEITGLKLALFTASR